MPNPIANKSLNLAKEAWLCSRWGLSKLMVGLLSVLTCQESYRSLLAYQGNTGQPGISANNHVWETNQLEMSCVSHACSVMSWLFETSRTVACQVLLSMIFSWWENLNGFPFPSPGDLPDPRIQLSSPAFAGRFFTTEPSDSAALVASAGKGRAWFNLHWDARAHLEDWAGQLRAKNPLLWGDSHPYTFQGWAIFWQREGGSKQARSLLEATLRISPIPPSSKMLVWEMKAIWVANLHAEYIM